MDNYEWLNEFQEDSWNRAIRFGEELRSKKLSAQESINEITSIENIIDAFLLKIFGTENSDKIIGISPKLIRIFSKYQD